MQPTFRIYRPIEIQTERNSNIIRKKGVFFHKLQPYLIGHFNIAMSNFL